MPPLIVNISSPNTVCHHSRHSGIITAHGNLQQNPRSIPLRCHLRPCQYFHPSNKYSTEMEHVRFLPPLSRFHISCPITGLHTQEINDCCDSIILLLELQGKLFKNFIGISNLLPCLPEIRRSHLGHEVGSGKLQLLEWIFFVERIALILARLGIYLNDPEAEDAFKVAGSQWRVWVASDNCEGIDSLAIFDTLGCNLTSYLKALTIPFNSNSTVDEALFLDCILNDEL
mmetsp:Transcript_33255/g.80444  ORF Transcript_33255/g.80444 Transcript_33255/m.80444 type:complete len:229 (-) Transcript_33255:2340-3026(-)